MARAGRKEGWAVEGKGRKKPGREFTVDLWIYDQFDGTYLAHDTKRENPKPS